MKNKPNRPTIGLILDGLEHEHPRDLLQAMQDLSMERDINLLCFVGGYLPSMREIEGVYGDDLRNGMFDLVNTEVIHGLVIRTGSISRDLEETSRLCNKYRPLPMINIGVQLDDIPMIVEDNRQGIFEAVTHLVKQHGYRRIAFIRGPEGNSFADGRYQAFLEALAVNKLDLDLDLVTPGIDWTRASGIKAMELLLDKRKVKFDAVMAANDRIALGAMQVLQSHSIRVPYDVAVIGFDNLQESQSAAVPLTTIQYPSYELGRQAGEILLAQIAGEPVPQVTMVPSRLIVRQSCGCVPQAVLEAGKGLVSLKHQVHSDTSLKNIQSQVINSMKHVLGLTVEGLDPDWADQIWYSFSREMETKESAFLAMWDKLLNQVGSRCPDLTPWENVLSSLRNQVLPCLNEEMRTKAEDLWHQARVILTQITLKLQAREFFQMQTQHAVLQSVIQKLISSSNQNQLLEIVRNELPHLEISSGYLSFYDQTNLSISTAQLIMAFSDENEIKVPINSNFPSQQLLPGGIPQYEKRFTYIVESLHFQHTKLGFLMITPPTVQTEVWFYETLRSQLSSSMMHVLLFQGSENK